MPEAAIILMRDRGHVRLAMLLRDGTFAPNAMHTGNSALLRALMQAGTIFIRKRNPFPGKKTVLGSY